LAALEPDLIDERHVLRVINDPLVDACLLWVGENGEQRLRILTVLNRATRAEHGAEADRAVKELDHLVATRAADLSGDLITVALETPGRLLDLCSARVSSLDEPALLSLPIAEAVDHHLRHDQAEAHGQYDGDGGDAIGNCGAD
jgi:hypothetical protein